MSTPTPRDPYNTALGALRRFAEEGRFIPGEPIVVTELAAEVGLSPTPVREALACLAGQGLIDRRRGRGYFYPALPAAELIDLFELQLAYLHAALTLYPRGLAPLRKAAAAVAPGDGVQVLFGAVIKQCANEALSRAHEHLADRMQAALQLERALDEPEGSTTQQMIEAIVTGRIPDLLALLADYHEARCARVDRLIGNTGLG